MLDTASAAERIEDYGGLERRVPGETYWSRGRAQKLAGLYAKLRRNPVPVLLDEIRNDVNNSGSIPPPAEEQLNDSVTNPNFID
ncbi:MAG: hypothetical protein WD887_00075 [Candidatus Saccharimonadales bacterium]